jgi:UDP-N-acetyl-D-glucosamine dehydrogenase
MNQDKGHLVVVGQGYVGLPLAMRALQVGWRVTGFDVDESRVKRLTANESFVEDIADEEILTALESGRYLPTLDEDCCTGFDVAVITVPTPLREGAPDLSFIEESSRMLGRHLVRGATIVLESTTYPGTTEELVAGLVHEVSGLRAGPDYHLGYSPERIDPGNRTWRVDNTPKVVSGIDAASLESVRSFYGALVERTVPVSSPRVAELTKLLENTFRHVNIALVNELAMFAHDLDIDVWEAIEAASTKPFGYLRFTPGPGVGGHCLPVDPSYLSWRVRRQLGLNFRFVELANDVNDHMPDYVVRRLGVALNEVEKAVKGSRVLVLGIAYKKNTGDARESPAIRVVELLQQLGAKVRAIDPYIEVDRVGVDVTLTDLCLEEVEAADAVLLLTDHDCFDFQLVQDHARLVLDTRARLEGPAVERL